MYQWRTVTQTADWTLYNRPQTMYVPEYISSSFIQFLTSKMLTRCFGHKQTIFKEVLTHAESFNVCVCVVWSLKHTQSKDRNYIYFRILILKNFSWNKIRNWGFNLGIFRTPVTTYKKQWTGWSKSQLSHCLYWFLCLTCKCAGLANDTSSVDKYSNLSFFLRGVTSDCVLGWSMTACSRLYMVGNVFAFKI
jgi:hypothetical protein